MQNGRIRLLIADDVGIGKTVEACLIARELLDRGENTRLAVLCPPHLAEQWQAELKDKFHIEAELVLSSTVSRLERQCGMGQSLFDVFPFVIVSTDYIKPSKRRDEFLRTCSKLVIVDEAHTCAASQGNRGGKHHRHELLKGLSADRDRNLILVTATPDSGIETGFRSLLSLLDERFADLPENLSGKDNERHRRRLVAHLIQRRRADIRSYLDGELRVASSEEEAGVARTTDHSPPTTHQSPSTTDHSPLTTRRHVYQTRLNPPPGPPADAEGNFLPLPQWPPGEPQQANWPPHIHPPKECVS